MRPIDADVLMSEMQETANFIARGTGKTAGLVILMKFIEIVKMYPTVEPKRGQWIKGEISEAFDIAGVKTWALKAKCSECGFVHYFIEAHMCYEYCPKCGAKMEGGDGMSLDKAIKSGKEKRKPYRGSKSIDATCRNHGGCPWCEENRLHKMRDKHPAETKGETG